MHLEKNKMTPIEKDIDVLDPTGSRQRHGHYKEIAQAEAGGFYSLKEQVLDHLNVGRAAIESEKATHYGIPDDWKDAEDRLNALIIDITNFKFN